uniref:Putative RNA-directed DNA polymerase from transposon X-element n=1 Tax=Bactrocera dorsalis TaxID=27457 RepID=A0A034VFD2_BACDO
MSSLKIVLWNANGIPRHKLELAKFLNDKEIDIMLLAETHLTNKYNFNVSGYTFYCTNHPDGKAHGGTGILIRSRIKHHSLTGTAENYLQATSICVQTKQGDITLSAVYCPPRFPITEKQFIDFFSSLGECFLAAGDYNAKHLHWGSRLCNPKGKQLYNALICKRNKLDYVSPGKPTYWPTDPNKLPDLIDFAVTRKIPHNLITAETRADLSSDHSPVLFTLRHQSHYKELPYMLTSKATNWLKYKKYISTHIELEPKLDTPVDIENTIAAFESTIITAAKISTPQKGYLENKKHSSTNREIEILVLQKRRLRREWQVHRSPASKQLLKAATHALTRALRSEEQRAQYQYIQKLSPTSTKHPLWKAHQTLSAPIECEMPIRDNNGKWARSDAEKSATFAAHLKNVFQPNPETNDFTLPTVPYLMESEPVKFVPEEISKIITEKLNPRKAPGHDLITPKMIIELPNCAIICICMFFNAITKQAHFPQQWKKSTIVMIPKPGKDKTQPSSYRPISLLSCMSKLFERLLMLRIKPHLETHNIIPSHQFGFREKHGTIEQVHRITSEIRTAFEKGEYCSAIFLDVAQAFDRVWLDGLMYKIKTLFPQNTHELFKSYLYDRNFVVRCNTTTSEAQTIEAGVPQGSVLGPMLYVLYTSDIPVSDRLTMSTFADDTAIISRSKCPIHANALLGNHIVAVANWLANWRIKVNEQKCKHVTFTLNKSSCSPLTLNNVQIPQSNHVTYLGVHLDRRLTWRNHIEAKRTYLKLKARSLHWLINSRSALSLEYKIIIYNTVLKPIWTYGCELWGNASSSNIEILRRAQSKILRTITGAPWYIRNENIQRDLRIPDVRTEIEQRSAKYALKLSVHPNQLARSLLRVNRSSRLRRNDLPAQM